MNLAALRTPIARPPSVDLHPKAQGPLADLILDLLQHGPATSREVAAGVGVTQKTAKNRLTALKAVGRVRLNRGRCPDTLGFLPPLWELAE